MVPTLRDQRALNDAPQEYEKNKNKPNPVGGNDNQSRNEWNRNKENDANNQWTCELIIW